MMDIRFIWTSLERQERQEYQAARGRLGRLWNLEAHWILQSPFPGWRVDNMRSALNMANHEAVRRLAERLAGLDVGVIAQALVETCRDIAVVWGGSMLLGAGAGAALGSLAGGVGAVPGALAGAGVGTQVGAWVLGALGLAALLQDLGDQIPQALRHYARGLELAWGQYSRSWTEEPNVHRAAGEIADGHVLLAVAVLSALAAYLTRGRGDPAVRGRILQQMRENPRLGARMADWVAANEDKLLAHPVLKPRQQQVTMSSAPAKDPGPRVTPAQLKRLREAGPDGTGKPPERPPPREPGPVRRLPPQPVPCFHPYNKTNFKRMSPPEQREYLEEMAKQLRRQEEFINNTSAAQFMAARENYAKYSRNPLAAKDQKALGEDFAEEVVKSISKSLERSGLGPGDARSIAKQRTQDLTGKLAALHEPDMVAGGWLNPQVNRMGRSDVNQSIGGSWNQSGRLATMDGAAQEAIRTGGADAKMNVKLEVCRGKGLR